jgi:putative transposase
MHLHRRRSIRIAGYDYSQPGYYFITLCTHDRKPLFGQIQDQQMIPNRLGELVIRCWKQIPEHYAHVDLDAFILMPNHLHGIVIIGRGMTCHAPTRGVSAIPSFGKPVAGSLARIIGSFKATVTRISPDNLALDREPIW